MLQGRAVGAEAGPLFEDSSESASPEHQRFEAVVHLAAGHLAGASVGDQNGRVGRAGQTCQAVATGAGQVGRRPAVLPAELAVVLADVLAVELAAEPVVVPVAELAVEPAVGLVAGPVAGPVAALAVEPAGAPVAGPAELVGLVVPAGPAAALADVPAWPRYVLVEPAVDSDYVLDCLADVEKWHFAERSLLEYAGPVHSVS